MSTAGSPPIDVNGLIDSTRSMMVGPTLETACRQPEKVRR